MFVKVSFKGLQLLSKKRIMRVTAIVAFVLLPLGLGAQNFVSQSVLSQGQFYKLTINQRGMHKLTPAWLRSLGISTGGLNPRSIRLFAGHQGMLPEPNASPRTDDLVEIPLWAWGESDGRLDESDYFLFFAEGPHRESYIPKDNAMRHSLNIYSDQNYYFLMISPQADGKRIETSPESPTPLHTIETYDELIWHEKDQINILQSGRAWFGEFFDPKRKLSFSYDIAGIDSQKPVYLRLAVLGQSYAASRFIATLNGLKAGELEVPQIFQGTYANKGEMAMADFQLALPNSSRMNLELEFVATSGMAYLDFFEINYLSPLRMRGSQLIFRSANSTLLPATRFRIADAQAASVWDITDPNRPVAIRGVPVGSNLEITVETNRLREFVAWRGTDFPLPASGIAIANQNLHGLQGCDLLILVPQALREQAERLAEFRRSHDNLDVLVVNTEQVYNEFSSGRQDLVALRDFVRMLYFRKGLRYVLLFGDASYDYKNRIPNNTNQIPVYESVKSVNPISSYSSDDFIGLLGEREGVWGDFDAETVEVGIGRLPVNTPAEAKTVVDKLIAYSQSRNALGDWRQVVVFVADDGDNNLHQKQADNLATMVDTGFQDFKVEKYFVDAFPQQNQGGARRSPVLRNLLNSRINSGALIVNFTGHGAEFGWTSEGILDISTIQSWRNPNRMPFFVTATCEFGRYDDPSRKSGAEECLLSPHGGAIGLITTTRPVYATTNFYVNQAFYEIALKPLPSGKMPRVGDIMVYTKNNSISGDINRNFALLGDPSMCLAYPKSHAVITAINGRPHRGLDTLSALERVKIEGEIRDDDDVLLPDFEGQISLQLFDKPVLKTTLGDEGPTMQFWERINTLYRGTASVKNGKFEFNFIIPKDIDYRTGPGRILLYAMHAIQNLDASGGSGLIQIGGGVQDFEPDDTPPLIEVFLENESFVDGQTVRPSPLLLVNLSDASGINTTGLGIGRDLMAIIDGDISNPLILNHLYRSETDDFTRGHAQYQFLPEEAFTPGEHTLKIIAWDAHNNFAEKEVRFRVAEKGDGIISQFLVFPNPTASHIDLSFCHNLGGNDLIINATLYSLTGAELGQWQRTITNTACVAGLRLDVSSLVAARKTGLHLLKVRVTSSSGTQAESIAKIVLLD